jgi:hypothetical protein
LWHSTNVTANAPPSSSSPAALADSPAAATSAPRASKLAYGVAIFASAFLLFELEPIIAKMILPWFGGVAAVWAVCLVFFQVTLLFGYLYAHLLARRFSPRAQGFIHAALLLASLFVLRIVPREGWKPTGPEHPALRILVLLCASMVWADARGGAPLPALRAFECRIHRRARKLPDIDRAVDFDLAPGARLVHGFRGSRAAVRGDRVQFSRS